MRQTPDGGYILTSRKWSSVEESDTVLIRMDGDGDVVRENIANGATRAEVNEYPVFSPAGQVADGHLIVMQKYLFEREGLSIGVEGGKPSGTLISNQLLLTRFNEDGEIVREGSYDLPMPRE